MLLRKLVLFSMIVILGVATASCGSPVGQNRIDSPQNAATKVQQRQNRLSDGQYPVQQATYNDETGEYEVALLNTKPGESSTYRAENLPMARLTDEEVKSGQKSYLKLESGQPSLHLTEDFRIEYIHNVTETRPDPQTGQPQTVVVERQSGFWAPFAGAIAGQALGSLLFRPQYYVPPVFQPGLVTGYGGYGSSYSAAVDRYQERYSTPPAAVRNRQAFRSTGQLRSPSYGQPSSVRRSTGQANRSTGSGYGGSNLRQNNRSNRSTYRAPSNRGFGSARPRSFGGSRRR